MMLLIENEDLLLFLFIVVFIVMEYSFLLMCGLVCGSVEVVKG